MHGCSLASTVLVNAEVYSMGRVTGSGGGVGRRASLRRSIVEKVQAELRQEYDVREERRRELEFLEKGGDPLDFRFGDTSSFSVQSTSPTDQRPEFEAKVGFAALRNGDSVESSGRPGAPSACEPNSADNLILFSGENYSTDGDKVSAYPSGENATLIEHPFQLDGSQNAKEKRDAATVGSGRKSYKRRDRSRPTRDGARSSSLDVKHPPGGNGISIPSFPGPMDFKESVPDLDKQDHKILSNGDLVSTCANMTADCKTKSSDTQLGEELDVVRAVKSTNDPIQGDPPDNVRDADAMKNLNDDQQKLEPMLDVPKSPVEQSSEHIESLGAHEVVFAKSPESRHSVPICPLVNQAISGQTKGYNAANRDMKSSPNSGKNNGPDANKLDSESSCTQSIAFSDGNNDMEMCTHGREEDRNAGTEPSCIHYVNESVQVCQVNQEKEEIKTDANFTLLNDECAILRQNHKEDGLLLKAGKGLNGNASDLEKESENQNRIHGEAKDPHTVESMDVDGNYGPGAERKNAISSIGTMNNKIEDVSSVGPQGSTSNVAKLLETASPAGVSKIASAGLTSSANLVPSTADEDLILEEARIIEAKHRMIAQFAVSSSSMCHRQKSHWDFVLEEMAWLANDFAQERLWKLTAASQVCRQAAFVSCSRFHEQNSNRETKKVAHFLATAVVKFWNSLEHTNQGQKLQCCNRDYSHALRDYALRFQIHNNGVLQAEVPVAPDKMSDTGIMDMLFSDHLPEENIFYKVLPGGMEKCRKSIESRVKYEKAGCIMQEEAERTTCDTIEDFVSQDKLLEGDEGETSTYYKSVSSRLSPKRRNFITNANGSMPLEVDADSQFVQRMERKNGIWGKCPADSLNVSFPTKRVRTTSNRQRIFIPFGVGTSACVQVPTKADASSGDTCYFQDDLSAFHDESHALNKLKVESVEDFQKQLLYDSAELSTKSKKKKKAKQSDSAYEPRWKADSNYQNDQRDLLKKRRNSHQFESNGLLGQYNAKKQKIRRQPNDSSFDSSAQVVGRSAPSPVASQNSNPNNLGKYFGGRDRDRKNKGLKVPGQPDSGNESPWSLFEDQALVVLVHDLGPNWDLISDAINSTLQFKCIFRKAEECKERHRQLMDRPACDGVDGSEDSGSTQPYSSTLPGIPKGSARQLFQRLQGPMEEDTLKSHFDKIIMIGQKLHCRRKQEPKQIQPPHGSHMVALTQVSPNNINGGPILTPLDLCVVAASCLDVLPLGYQSPHSGGLPFYNQGTVTSSVLAVSGANSLISGSPNSIMGNNFPSSPTTINPSVKDGRYTVPRSTSLSIEDKQRMQQYNNQMLPARNFPQTTNISSPRTLQRNNDCGGRMLLGGNGVPIASGISSRNSSIARPGCPVIALPSVLNSGNMMSSSGMVAMPTQNQDPQRQMMVPDIQMPVSQGILPPFGVQISSFTSQTGSPPPLPSYSSLHHQQQQPHAMSPQQSHPVTSHHSHPQGTNHASAGITHQAYAMRLAKGKPLQQQQHQHQQFFQQPQQQFASPNNMMTHGPPLAQLPLSSSSPQNSPRIAQQTSIASASPSPFTPGSPVIALHQNQQPHQKLANGVVAQNVQTANSIKNQIGKQRRQPQPQSNPQSHKKQRQSQSQQSVGRGKTVMNNTTPIEPTIPNGFSTNPGYPSLKKGEAATIHSSQGQGMHPGSPMNHVRSGKPLVPRSSSQSHPLQRMSSLSEHAHQGHVSPVSEHQSVPPIVMNASGQPHPQAQGNQKSGNQSEPCVQRVLHPNIHGNSTMLQENESQTNQTPAAMGNSIIMPKAPNGVGNGSRFTSPASSQSRDSESLCDSGTSSQIQSSNPASKIPSSQQVGHRLLGQKNPSDNSPPGVHNVTAKWQQQPPVQLLPSDSQGNQHPPTSTTATGISISAAETTNEKYVC